MDSSSISAKPDITVATTQPRVTPTPNRGAFKQVLASGASTIVRGAETAMKMLPGAPLMAVAVRGATGSSSLGVPLSGIGGGNTPEGSSVRSASFTATAQNAGLAAMASATGTTAGTTGTTGTTGTDGSLESSIQQSADMNLYYLQIQQEVDAQNRQFSTLSNVLKTENDTIKNAIGNIH